MLLTISETAIKLKVSPAMVRSFIKNDKTFPYASLSKKTRRIDAETLDKWILKRSEKSTQPANA